MKYVLPSSNKSKILSVKYIKICQIYKNISKNTTYSMKQAFSKTCILKIGKLKVKEKKERVLEDVMNLSKPKI